MKILNENFINLEVGLRDGLVKFDEKGIADVQPDDYAQELLELQGFYPVNEEGEKVEPEVPETPEEEEEVQEPEAPKYDLTKMTGKELDALAKELEIEDYPKDATVAVRKAAIGAFLATKK